MLTLDPPAAPLQGREATGRRYHVYDATLQRSPTEEGRKLATSLQSHHRPADSDVRPLQIERAPKAATGTIMPAPVWRTATGAAYIRTRRVRPNEDGSVDRVFVSEGASLLFWKSRTYRIVWERPEL
jgi:hypothetical protein